MCAFNISFRLYHGNSSTVQLIKITAVQSRMPRRASCIRIRKDEWVDIIRCTIRNWNFRPKKKKKFQKHSRSRLYTLMSRQNTRSVLWSNDTKNYKNKKKNNTINLTGPHGQWDGSRWICIYKWEYRTIDAWRCSVSWTTHAEKRFYFISFWIHVRPRYDSLPWKRI